MFTLSSLGAIVVASWLNTALYTVQLVLSSWYLIKHKPLRIIKWGIWVSLIVDAITSIVLFASTWMVLLQLTAAPPPSADILSNPTVIPPQVGTPWTLPAQLILTSFSVALEHCFFAYRYWSISKDMFLTSIIVLLVLGHEASVLAGGIYASTQPMFGGDTNSFHLLVAGSACAAAADIVIAGALAYRLKQFAPLYTETKNVLHRIAIASVSCGITTTIAAILAIVFMLTDNSDASYVMVAILGRVYSLTVIANLIILKLSAQMRRTTLSSGSGRVVLPSLYIDHNSVLGKRLTMPNYPKASMSLSAIRQSQDGPVYSPSSVTGH